MSPQEITLAIAFLIQFATIVWFLASLNAKVTNAVDVLVKLIAEFDAHQKSNDEIIHRHSLKIQALEIKVHPMRRLDDDLIGGTAD